MKMSISKKLDSPIYNVHVAANSYTSTHVPTCIVPLFTGPCYIVYMYVHVGCAVLLWFVVCLTLLASFSFLLHLLMLSEDNST